jgi:hypothetical protein
MNIAVQRNIGALIAVVTSVPPQSGVGGAINGASIDRMQHNMAESCVVHQAAGAISGAPTAAGVVTKLQHSPDNVNWSDYILPGSSTVAVTPALGTQNTENSLAVQLTSANRYIRAVSTATFTGGSAPAAIVCADVILAGEDLLAAI